jgi:hypothetical protein
MSGAFLITGQFTLFSGSLSRAKKYYVALFSGTAYSGGMTLAYLKHGLRRKIAKHGLADIAKQLDVSVSYLHDVARGRRKPGRKILKGLGLRKVVDYVPMAMFLVLCLTGATNASAQDKRCRRADAETCWNYWGTPHFWRDAKWYAGEAAVLAARGADIWSTERALHNGASEGNWLVGPHPSRRTLVLVGLGFAGGQTALHAFAHSIAGESQSRFDHALGNVFVPAIIAGVTAPAIIHNFGLRSQCAQAKLACDGD